MQVVTLLWLGLSAAAASSQPLIGGTTTTADPAVVSWTLRGPTRCTGVLIGARTVLTAAHCAVADSDVAQLSVRFELGSEVPIVRGVASQHPHPLFVRGAPRHDVMLLELSEPVPQVQPIALYPQPIMDADVGRELRVVAYGVTQAGTGNGIGVKREAGMSITRLTEFQLEAAHEGVQTCDGDSGAPAFLRNGDQEFVAATVSSGNRTCDSIDFFSRIDVESSWISSTAVEWGDQIASCANCQGSAAPTNQGCGCNSGLFALMGLAVLVLRRLSAFPSARRAR